MKRDWGRVILWNLESYSDLQVNLSIGRKRPSLKKNLLILFLFIGLSFLVYANALDNSFHFDDMHYVVRNPYIQDTGNIPAFFKSPRYGSSVKDFTSHYRPLTVTGFALNYAAGGLNPVGYHLVNLAFHIGASFLVFLIVAGMTAAPTPSVSLRAGPSTSLRAGPSTSLRAGLAAGLIFALHPFNSEVVNYITARSSVMCAFFYLLAFWCWIKYRESEGRFPFYLASFFSFLLAMLSKEIAVTLPVIIWVYDRFFFKIPDSKSRLAGLSGWTLPYLPFILLVAVPYLLIRKIHYGMMITEWMPEKLLSNLATQPLVLTEYLRLLFFPVGLTIDHGLTRSQGFGDPWMILYTLLLLTLLILTFFLYRTGEIWRIVSFFVLWFFIALLPTTLIPLNALLQENRGYLAGTAFAAFVGIGLAQWGRRRGPWILLALLLVVYAMATFQRNKVWENDLTLWSDAVQKTPDNPRALDNLGLAFYRAGDLKKAEIAYLRTLQINPGYAYAHYNLGLLYKKKGNWSWAEIAFQRAALLNPNHYNTFLNLGVLYQKTGRLKEAAAAFERAVSIDSRNPSAFLMLGDIYLELQEKKRAAVVYQKVLDIDPDHEGAQKKLARMGDPNVEK